VEARQKQERREPLGPARQPTRHPATLARTHSSGALASVAQLKLHGAT
jgi:hypothetical protein